MSLNKVMLIGHLGRNPEIKKLPSGHSATTVNLATNTTYKDKNGERQKNTEWHRITLYRKTAEIVAEYCQKGDMIYIEGSLQYRKYTDKNNIERYVTDIVGNKVTFLVTKQKQSGKFDDAETSETPTGTEVTYTDTEKPPKDAFQSDATNQGFEEDEEPF